MTPKIMFLTALLALSGAAYAAVDTTDMDTNGDGVLSYDEVLSVYSTLTGEDVAAIDTNNDGALSVDELNAADEAGLLPVMAD